jgi:hypothetical protein
MTTKKYRDDNKNCRDDDKKPREQQNVARLTNKNCWSDERLLILVIG